jgi:Saxitoxin biosynthesis operon protein SxtJ
MMKKMSRDNLDKIALRQFCFSMALGFGLFFYLLLPWIFNYHHPVWAIIVAAIFFALALINPIWSYPIYYLWRPVAHVMGWVNSHLLLGLVFYGLFFPIGGFMRWRNKLGYQARWNSLQKSYFMTNNKKFNRNDMENPF